MNSKEIYSAFDMNYNNIRQHMIDYTRECCKLPAETTLYWYPENNDFEWQYDSKEPREGYVELDHIPLDFYSDPDLSVDEITDAYEENAVDERLQTVAERLEKERDLAEVLDTYYTYCR